MTKTAAVREAEDLEEKHVLETHTKRRKKTGEVRPVPELVGAAA